MRLGGFEPPTRGLEGRRSSAELQARSLQSTRAFSAESQAVLRRLRKPAVSPREASGASLIGRRSRR
jgi:hypothetical protein